MLMHHPERKVESCQWSFGVDEIHVKQVWTEAVQNRVEHDPVLERFCKVVDDYRGIGVGHGFSAPAKERPFKIRQWERLKHLVKLVAQNQVPYKSQGHFWAPVDNVRRRNVYQRHPLLIPDGLQRRRYVAQHVNPETATLPLNLFSSQDLDQFDQDPAIAEIVEQIGDRKSVAS